MLVGVYISAREARNLWRRAEEEKRELERKLEQAISNQQSNRELEKERAYSRSLESRIDEQLTTINILKKDSSRKDCKAHGCKK